MERVQKGISYLVSEPLHFVVTLLLASSILRITPNQHVQTLECLPKSYEVQQVSPAQWFLLEQSYSLYPGTTPQIKINASSLIL